jgi:hypothetical protein
MKTCRREACLSWSYDLPARMTIFFFFFCSCCSHLKHGASVKRLVSLKFLNLRQSVGLLGRGISPSQGHYVTQTQNKHKQTLMPWVGFEHTIPVFERAKIFHAFDRAAIVVGTPIIEEFKCAKNALGKYVCSIDLLLKGERSNGVCLQSVPQDSPSCCIPVIVTGLLSGNNKVHFLWLR